jgi:predicted enzyme related to lactoylglutathione lyase
MKQGMHSPGSSVTHFEIYGEEPSRLVDFYREVLGWQVEQMPGINYWRIQTSGAESPALHGGLAYRAIPHLNGWIWFVNVASLR